MFVYNVSIRSSTVQLQKYRSYCHLFVVRNLNVCQSDEKKIPSAKRVQLETFGLLPIRENYHFLLGDNVAEYQQIIQNNRCLDTPLNRELTVLKSLTATKNEDKFCILRTVKWKSRGKAVRRGNCSWNQKNRFRNRFPKKI